MDWNEIKAEYISTKIGYRELAKKNGLSFSRLQRRATGEKWPELRRQLCGGGTEAVGSGGDRATRVQNVADLLLDKIALTIENMDGSSNRAVKDVSDSLKIVRDIMGVKSDYDLKEQELRLAKLRREAEDSGNTDRPVVVRFEGCDDDWCG